MTLNEVEIDEKGTKHRYKRAYTGSGFTKFLLSFKYLCIIASDFISLCISIEYRIFTK